ncbi:DeoR/GlpR family DNA-binding transcription regulator [Aestuariivirga sp.]|uniref:DeoR/GlpR family DNA-binding transcription regulator n=1 Tax=Aestuariivirga sp. TaxID=2650926 RepID=UPI0035AE3D4D
MLAVIRLDLSINADSCNIVQYRALTLEDEQAPMLTTARKAFLIERLAREGSLTVTPLAAELNVSEDTLRRDLRDLASEGLLVRVHGGAVQASPTHRPVAARQALHAAEKQKLARAAAELIESDSVVIVDGGTTHLYLAAAVPPGRSFTLVTHSPAVACSFEHHDNVEIILIGGRIFRHSMVALGSETAQAFARIRADLCLLGVTGVHGELGLTTGDAEEAALKRAMAGAAAETVVAATPDKIGRANPWGVLTLNDIATLITVQDRPDWLPERVTHIAAA